eukprot:8942418-Pyramimonas_sp.AAC.1
MRSFIVFHTIAPNIHIIAPNIYTIAPNIHTIAPNIHTIAPNASTIAPNIHSIAPNIHTIAPNIHTIAPNIHTIAPNIHTISTYIHTIAPYIHIRLFTFVLFSKRDYLLGGGYAFLQALLEAVNLLRWGLHIHNTEDSPAALRRDIPTVGKEPRDTSVAVGEESGRERDTFVAPAGRAPPRQLHFRHSCGPGSPLTVTRSSLLRAGLLPESYIFVTPAGQAPP